MLAVKTVMANLMGFLGKHRYVALILLLVVAVGLYLFASRTLEPREAIVIKSAISDGFLIGGVDNNGGVRPHSLYPCASSESEVLRYLNQLISWNEIHKDNLPGYLGYGVRNIPLIESPEKLETNFSIEREGFFYKITKRPSTYVAYFDSYLPAKSDTWYVCNANFFPYLNSDFGKTVIYSGIYYPFDIDKRIFEEQDVDHRVISREYINDPAVGVTKIVRDIKITKEFSYDLMNLMYEIGHFELGGFNSKAKIISRDISQQGWKWVVTDAVRREVYDDTLSFGTTRYNVTNKLVIDGQSRRVISEISHN